MTDRIETGLFDEEQWTEIERLVGRVVLRWGRLMGLVYALPEKLGFPNDKAIVLGLAQLSGDGSRLDYMRKLLQHAPPLHSTDCATNVAVLRALKSIAALIPERDSIVHGIPLWSMKRDAKTRLVIRDGYYLSQPRQWDESTKYLKVPEVVQDHLAKLDAAYESLLPFAAPILFKDWSEIFGIGDTDGG